MGAKVLQNIGKELPELLKLNLLNPYTFPLGVSLIAYSALVPEVGLLGLLLAGHLPLGNRRLAVTAKVSRAASPAPLPGPYLGAVFQGAGSLLLGKEHLMLGMLPAVRAEALDSFAEFHLKKQNKRDV